MRATTFTLGCKQNQYESVAMGEILVREGYTLVPPGEPADLVVVNTCTVTGHADYQARQTIRKLRRRNPGAPIVVTGCYAQRDPDQLAEIDGVAMVLGNNEKSRLAEYLRELHEEQAGLGDDALIRVGDISEVQEADDLPIQKFRGYTRAFLKIQDGCNLRCSYCIIPSVRGRNRSLPPEKVVAIVENLVANGQTEIVLTGIHIGHYGKDFRPRKSLVDLLKAILAVPGVERIRLSSLEPSEFTPDLVDFIIDTPEICRHFHIPIQSGSARILKLMRRPYNKDYYVSLLEKLFTHLPDVGIGADVIVGFPGETDEDFAESCRILERFPMSYLHVFSYSDREGTKADATDAKTPTEVIRQRSKTLRKLSREAALRFRRGFEGRELDCHILRDQDAGGLVEAVSDNYIRMSIKAQEEIRGTRQRVRLETAGFPFSTGSLVEQTATVS